MTPPAPDAVPVLEARGLSKRFGGILALSDLDLALHPGIVHAIVGENGAGKSTLVKLLAGAEHPDTGELLVDGRRMHLRTVREAMRLGIVLVAQEVSLVPNLTVLQNVFLGREGSRVFRSERRLLAEYDALTATLGFRPDPRRAAGSFSIADQQQIEILRALARSPRVLILDEPTAALTPPEKERLFSQVSRLKAAGCAVVYISHFLDEVVRLADRVTVLRNGRLISTSDAVGQTPDTLVSAMIGRDVAHADYQLPQSEVSDRVRLNVTALSAPGVGPVDLEVRAGEVVGLGGLMGSGRSRLLRTMFGAERRIGGTVTVDGGAPLGRGVRAAIRRGVALVPESRKDDGLLLERPIWENVLLVHPGRSWLLGPLFPGAAKARVVAMFERLRIAASTDPGRSAVTLSGGNQQKLMLAKWLVKPPAVLLIDEPTRGVDVDAKHGIHLQLKAMAAAGSAVVVVSSESEELFALSDRLLVMRAGAIAGELDPAVATEQQLLELAFGRPSTRPEPTP